MKTFRWTVPEFPRTKHERGPRKPNEAARRGTFNLLAGILAIGLGIVISSGGDSLHDLSRGFQTYFWTAVSAEVIDVDIADHEKIFSGTVTYAFTWADQRLSHEDEVSRRVDEEETSLEYFRVGENVMVYVADLHRSSLGRWPDRVGAMFGIYAIGWLLVGLNYLRLGFLDLRDAKTKKTE
ncbi:MAG: hypothetical protein AAGH99_09390 [Planctomycetota bacterium]